MRDTALYDWKAFTVGFFCKFMSYAKPLGKNVQLRHLEVT